MLKFADYRSRAKGLPDLLPYAALIAPGVILNKDGSFLAAWEIRGQETHLYLRHNGPEHIVVFAPTRSGKGVGLILPTLLAWKGSSIVLDIKDEKPHAAEMNLLNLTYTTFYPCKKKKNNVWTTLDVFEWRLLCLGRVVVTTVHNWKRT